MSEHLDKLRELTGKLPELIVQKLGNILDYKVAHGTSRGFGLVNTTMTSIQTNFMSSGTTFERHAHYSTEWLIIIRGRLKVYLNGEDGIEIGVSEGIRLPGGIPHYVEALEDTDMVGILIPGDPEKGGYPDAR